MERKCCPFLSGRQIRLCGAFEATLVLDVEELEIKCNTPKAWEECKIYKKRMRDEHPLPVTLENVKPFRNQ